LSKDILFLDTAFVYALFNTRDQWHGKAVAWQEKIAAEKIPLMTTQFVLTEIADGLSSVKFRGSATKIIHAIEADISVRIISASPDLFRQALTLYEARSDKNWGLTDWASFVVMIENNLTDALTADQHFRQAGFKALLLD
jgi:predicted nucleic acid-binding protein